MRSKRALTALVMLGTLLPGSRAMADFYFEEEQRVGGVPGMPTTPTTVRSWYKGDKVKIAMDGQDQVLIVDYSQQRLLMLRPSARTYSSISLEGNQAMMGSALQQWGITQKPDGSIRVPKDLFKPTGKRRRIGKWKAFEVTMPLPAGSQGAVSLWFSKDVGVTMRDLEPTLRASLAGGESKELEAFFKRLLALDGYPVLTTMETVANGQQITITKELKVARKKAIPEKTFAVPDGYVDIKAAPAPSAKSGAPKTP